MNLAEERQQMVLAHAEEFDVAHHHHLVVLYFVQRAVEHLLDIGSVAAGEELERLIDALGRAPQALAAGILAQASPESRESAERCWAQCRSNVQAWPLRLHHFDQLLYGISWASISKMLRAVSAMRTLSSFGHSPGNAAGQPCLQAAADLNGKVLRCRRRSRNAATSQLRFRWSNGCSTSRATSSSRRRGSTAQPVFASSRPARAHFQYVVVAVPVRVVALAVETPVLLLAQPRARAGDGRPRTGSGGSRGTRLLSEVIHVQVRRFVHPHRMQTAAAAGKLRLDAPPDVAGDVFRRGNHAVERRHFVIQEAVVVTAPPPRGSACPSSPSGPSPCRSPGRARPPG